MRISTASNSPQRSIWQRHRWLILRRVSQLGILLLFLCGPWFGLWLVKGNLSSSLTLGVIPLTDPYILLQTLFAGHLPEVTAIIGALIIAAIYFLIGGRVYCGWVCPLNMVTDLAAWLQEKLKLKTPLRLERNSRYWLLGLTLTLPVITGMVVWELVNPVSVVQRGLIFGMGLSWAIIIALFLFDLVISRRGWCGHLCPVGAFYSLLNHSPLLRINAAEREQCNDCGDCYLVCPEPQIIKPALKPAEADDSAVIMSSQCLNCGRCIDVCEKQVFHFGSRFQSAVHHTATEEGATP